LSSNQFIFFKKFLNLAELTLKIVFYSFKLKPDLIHCHDAFSLIPCFIISIFRKTKIVYDAHELESDKNGQNKIFKFITIFFEKIMWRKIDVLISVSDSIIEWYKKNYGFKNSLLLFNKPSLKLKKDKETFDLRKKYKIDKNKLLFIYLGDLCDGRGIDLILEVFSKYRIESNVVFLGDGILKDLVLKYSQKFKNIFYHEKVKHDKVVNITKTCDVGLCFIEDISKSDSLSLPNKIFEYASAGINILGSDLPEISKFIKTYQAGIISKYDINHLNKSVKFFERNKLFDIKIKGNNFSWESQEEFLLKIYKDLLF
tara:strand:+ start:1249 stop:2190 length:942 start_codon:yes stop_codon:yes gene_type:complete